MVYFNILNRKQEEKWRLKENKVYIKPSIDKQQRVFSKESCTNVEGSLLSQAEDNFKGNVILREKIDKIGLELKELQVEMLLIV